MSLSSLIFTTGIDGNGFQRGLMSMKREASATGAQIATAMNNKLATIGAGGVFAAVTAGLTAMTKSALDYQSAIDDAQDQFGMTADDIQRLSPIANEAGTDLGAVAAAIDKISEARKKLASGDKEIEKSFAAFGVPKELGTFAGASSLQILRVMSDSLGDTITEEQRRMFADLAGDKGRKILTFVKEMKAAGPIAIVSNDQLEALGKVNDGVSRLWHNIKAINAAFVGELFSDIFKSYKTDGLAGLATSLVKYQSTIVQGAAKAVASMFDEGAPIGSESNAGAFRDAKKEDKEAKQEKAARRNVFGGMETRGGADSLASVGLFVRGGAGSLVDVQRRQLDVLTRMEAMQRDLLRVTREVL